MKTSKLGALAAAGALVVGLAACGDDGEDVAETGAAPTTTEAPAEEETTTTAAPEGDGGEERDGDGPPDVNPCADGGGGTLGPATPPADGATAITVTASEYRFEGLEAITGVGEYAITLTNAGQELHEIAFVRLADSETRPVEAIIASEEELELTEIAFAFACPGATAEPTAASVSEPGRYVAVCFIPVGTTPETDPAELESMGPPHAAQGMVQEVIIES